MIMVADAIRLALFPAMMAFAASSDLLTLTISNRVSLILVGGFVALALIGGVSAADVLSHLAAGCVVLVAAFSLFARGIVGGGHGTLARLRSSFALSALRIPAGRGVERGAGLVPHDAAAGLAGTARLGAAAARQGRRRALRYCPCRRGACRLPAHAMDGDRNVIAHVPSVAISHRSTDY